MTETGRIRVATFNIQHGATREDPYRGDPKLVAQACAELDVDILGLQEVDIGVPRTGKADMVALAAEASGMNSVPGMARTYRGRGQFGNALLVRGDISDVELIKLKGGWHTVKVGAHRLKLMPEPRNAIIANVTIGGQELAVGVTHLGGQQERQLGEVATAMVRRTGPKLLLGDFNLKLAKARACLEPYGLEVFEGPNTSEAWNPRQQIDHIAASGLHLLSIYTHPRFPIADHLALVGEVGLAEQ